MFVHVCGSVTTIIRIAYIDPHKTEFVGKGSDYLQLLIKFWPSRAPGKGYAVGRNFWLRALYYSQRAVFASPPSAFSYKLLLRRNLFSLLLIEHRPTFCGQKNNLFPKFSNQMLYEAQWRRKQFTSGGQNALRRPKKILICPQFSLVPPHEGGTTIVCYRLWETIEVSPFIVSALQSAHLLVKSGEGQ